MCIAKDNINKINRQVIRWESIFYMFDKHVKL